MAGPPFGTVLTMLLVPVHGDRFFGLNRGSVGTETQDDALPEQVS
ncbi:hypothetical protein [Pelagimonas varians]|nr:hypothetical protein [Pelagimonas varians]